MLKTDFFLLNNDNKPKLSYGYKDMNCCDYFLESELMNLPSTNIIDYMYFHVDISNREDVPIHRDGINCGVCSLWYLLQECYDEVDAIDLNA